MGELVKSSKSKLSQANVGSSSSVPREGALNVDKNCAKSATVDSVGGASQADDLQPASECRQTPPRTAASVTFSGPPCRSSKSFENEQSPSSGTDSLSTSSASGTQVKSCLGPVRSLDSTKSNESSSTVTNLDCTSTTSASNLASQSGVAAFEATDSAGRHESGQKPETGVSSTQRRTSAAASAKNVKKSSSGSISCIVSGSNAPANQQQSKQMFSLKQLAINSRNLTGGKKRASLQSTGGSISTIAADSVNGYNSSTSAKQFPFKFKVNNSSSNQLNDNSSKSGRTYEGKSSNFNYNSSDNFDSDDDDNYDDSDDDDDFTSDEFDDEEQDDEDTLSNSSDYYDDDSNSFSSNEEENVEERDVDDQKKQQQSQQKSSLQVKVDKEKKKKKEQTNKSSKKGTSDKGKVSEVNMSVRSGFGVDRRNKKRRSERNARNRSRRGSSCNCELVINRIDFDGQPVTDVDFVTYKHLCHLEQRQQQIRANLRKKHWQSQSGSGAGSSLEATSREQQQINLYRSLYENAANFFEDFRVPQATPTSLLSSKSHQQKGSASVCGPVSLNASYRLSQLKQQQQHRGASLSASIRSNQLKRRSSLQEESGAYYQLCTSPEEQAIRQKYIWFPPSLKTLQLVDQFFSSFSKDKIPYAPVTANQQQQQQQLQSTTKDSKLSQQNTTSSNNSGSKQSQNEAAQPSQSVASSLVCSYRDEQISFQLPRQDISLDYCSYNMDEQGRANYLQFVNKRNSQALDVASVIQVSLFSNTVASSSGSSGQKQAAADQQATSSGSRQRKQSSASQIVVSESNCLGNGGGGSIASQQVPPVSQRCRRCLVRFEDGQLAVVAPNFSIGTGIYSHHHHHHHHNHHHNHHQNNSNSSSGQQQQHQSSGRQQGASSDSVSDGGELSSRRASVNLLQHSTGLLDCPLDQAAPISSLLAPTLASSVGGASQVVVVPTKPNLAMFHPQCFTCSTCKEFLVDLVYCLRDSKLYCLRHYGESIRPRCNWCQELLASPTR